MTNIAEILKNCPKGMELDCVLYDDVTLGSVDYGCYPIQVQTPEGNMLLSQYGCTSLSGHAKCIIFPKGKTTWEGFVPPCQFKDGDIVYAIDGGNEYIFIFKHKTENGQVYCYLNLKGGILRIQEVWLTDYNPTTTHRFATEEEKQKLFDAIKANGYKWNAETKTLEKLIGLKFKIGDRVKRKKDYISGVVMDISDDGYKVEYQGGEVSLVSFINFAYQNDWELFPNKFDITTLKPFYQVLVRQNNSGKWGIDFFGSYKEGYYYVTGNCAYLQCIPYEGNEHLLNTNNDCDEFYKNWE